MTKKEFREMIERGAVILDGATGSNLQEVGMKPGVCPEQWILEHPEAILNLQRKYVEAGTNILYAPTFTANRIKLAEYGLSGKVSEINRTLVRLSKEAAGGRAYVAADISMTGRQLYPIGDLAFEELVEVYKEQVRALEEAGVDLYAIETMMSLQECRAALLAVRECSSRPVIVSLTYEQTGRTLYGTDPKTAVIVLQSLGADAVGMNCSMGPDQMAGQVRAMYEAAYVPILVKPNAGLPELVDGKTIYGMEPRSFADAACVLAECGARIFGGCCGTTPAHIREMAQAVREKKLLPVQAWRGRFLASERGHVEIRPDGAFTIVGERINPTGKKLLSGQLREGRLDMVCEMAADQQRNGAAVLDVNLGTNGIDEEEMMVKAIGEISAVSDAPLCIDSSSAKVIEAALRIYPGRALINSISLEKEKCETLLAIAKKYGAMFILLPLSDEGLPENMQKKHQIIEEIAAAAFDAGLEKEDIVVDGLAATVGANPLAARECIETIAYCRDKGFATICGLSNISFGLPERGCLNMTFLATAIANGLTMAIANPGQEALMDAAYAADLLLGKEGADLRYIQRMNAKKEQGGQAGKSGNAQAQIIQKTPQEAVYDCVIEGNKGKILDEVKRAAAEGKTAKEILDGSLIPAIGKTGDLFEQQIYFLPQLIASAETMQKAVAYLEPMLGKGSDGEREASIVLATVEGDIHDIGKNLVALMLKNYGCRVIDLGKDVPAERIVETAMREDAAFIGLSALMTTTMMRMKDVVILAKERGCKSKILIGGAAVTAGFAKEIGADGYSKDAAECVRLVAGMGLA